MTTHEYDLTTRYDRRKSFYGKAKVVENSDGSYDLYSYGTHVSHCSPEGMIQHLGRWSQTTSRHQREFEKQFGKN